MKPKRANTSFLEDIADEYQKSEALGTSVQQLQAAGIRIESLPIQLVRPNPANPRRLFPYDLSLAFHNGELPAQQALAEFIEHVQTMAYRHGRGFDNVVELLPSAHEDEKETIYTPEEKTLRDLVILAVTLRDDDQIYPLTVVNVGEGPKLAYMIETGERRYWATWILMDYIPGYKGDGTLPCADVSSRYSVYRMAKENTTSSPLNAMAMARQIALLLLDAHGIRPPVYGISNDFYRQALGYDLRSKSVSTSDVLTALGGIDRRQFSRYKSLLNLCDGAMEMADRFNVEEFRLRSLVDLDAEGQVAILQTALEKTWDARQIAAACVKWRMGERPEKQESKLPPAAMNLARAVLKVEKTNAQDVVAALAESGQDVNVIRARIKQFRRLLDEAESLLPDA